MIIHYTVAGSIFVPDGSRLDVEYASKGESPRKIILPNGDFVKIFPIVELNDDRDLSYSESLNHGIDIGDSFVNLEVDTENESV